MTRFLLIFACIFLLIGCAVDTPQAESTKSAAQEVCTCGSGNAIPSGTCYSTCKKSTCFPEDIPWAEGFIYYDWDSGLQECRQYVDGDYCTNDFKCIPGLKCVPYYDQGNGEGACNCDCTAGLMCGTSNDWLDSTTNAMCMQYCYDTNCDPTVTSSHLHCVQTAQNEYHYTCI